MSLQNLLEMDELGRSFSSSGKAPPKAMPRPLPRSRVPKQDSFTKKKSTDADEVLSISSGGSIGKDKGSFLSHRKGSFATNSFDNTAFVRDGEDFSGSDGPEKVDSPSNSFDQDDRPGQPVQPQPKQRKKAGRQDTATHLTSLFNRSNESESDTDHRNENLVEPANGNQNTVFEFRKEDDDDNDNSSATFTIENEKYQSPSRLTKKPPIPKPKRLKTATKKSVRLGSPSEEAHQREDEEINRDSPEKRSLGSRKGKEYSAVQIEPDKEPDGNDNDNTNDINNGDAEQGEAEPSPAPVPTKDSVKSRFGKFFASSSSSSKHKKSTDTDKVSVTDEKSASVAGKDKSGLVNRWKKTFSRSSSKPLQDDVEDHVEKEAEVNEVPSAPTTKGRVATPEKKKGGKAKETRIFIPAKDSSSEDDDASVISGVTPKSNQKFADLKRQEARDKTIESDNSETQLAQEEVTVPERKPRFKPFSNLTVSKSKEKADGGSKEKETKKPKLERKEPSIQTKSKKELNPEKVSKGKQRQQKKVTVEQRFLRPGEKSEFSESSLSEGDENDRGSNVDSASGGSNDEDTMKEPEATKSLGTRRKKVSEKAQVIPCTDSASGKDLLFGVTVHSSDMLPLDPNVIHPVVKVTVMLQSGRYMRRSTKEENQPEPDSENKSRHGKSERKSKRRNKQNKNDDDDPNSTPNAVDSVLPIMSQPCRARHSIPTFAPTWNELLVFEEPFKRFAVSNEPKDSEQEPILFFEIMDFLPMNNNGNAAPITGFHGRDAGWYKVAWAFLKPMGANGVMNLNKKLRLQLYRPVKVRSRDLLPGPEVFSWWKLGNREKVNATLYMTPKGILPPETKSASLRQLLSMRKEQLTQAILDSQLASRKKKESNASKSQSLYDLREYTNWTRMEGQSCKPPNKLVKSLPSSQIESLNIVISGNVYITKFSPCGHILAAGLDTEELHVVLLFKVPSWTLMKSLKGHHGIIYDISWKIFDLDNDNFYHYLATASADSTVRIWKIKNCDDKSLTLVKVLYHPSYVYCVQFYPTHPCLVATGCFDFVIRIWDVKPDHSEINTKDKRRNSKGASGIDASPIILLDKHSSFVNCLAFDTAGQHLFSGDGGSCIFKWNCMSPTKKKSWRLEKDVKLHHGNVPVNCINLHPSGSRLLVHLRDNFLKILDVITLIPLLSFSGLHNARLQIRSCFSPCGNLVLSGSEDSTLCVWDADTGKILQLTTPQNHPNCVVSCVDYHPFDYYVAVGLASTISEPSPILIYFYHQPKGINYPMLMKTARRMRQSIDKSRSQSIQSFDHDTAVSQRGGASGPFPTKRGDSSEKFISIIQKLDTALYFAQQRNQKRRSEAESSACLSTFESEAISGELDRTVSKGGNSLLNAVDRVDGSSVSQSRRHFLKKPPHRPRSASSTTAKSKRERFRQSNDQRDTKSDSEQSYQLKKLKNGQPNSVEKVDSDEGERFSGKELVGMKMATECSSTNSIPTHNNKTPEKVQFRPKPSKRRTVPNFQGTGTSGNV